MLTLLKVLKLIRNFFNACKIMMAQKLMCPIFMKSMKKKKVKKTLLLHIVYIYIYISTRIEAIDQSGSTIEQAIELMTLRASFSKGNQYTYPPSLIHTFHCKKCHFSFYSKWATKNQKTSSHMFRTLANWI